MQKGVIKEVKEVAKEGKQTFYAVELQDGTEMTTFDPKIKQAEPGDGLEFEVTVSAKGDKTYVNLKDGFTITKSSSSVSPVKGNGYPDMSKEDWVEKQRVERESIEAQTAVKAILSLVGAFETEADSPFRKIVSKALDWCEARIDATIKESVKAPVKAPAKVKSPEKEMPAPINPDEVEFDDSPVKNFGDLWTRCALIDLTKKQALELYGVDSQSEIADLDEAWKTVFDRKFGKQEEVKSEEDIPF